MEFVKLSEEGYPFLHLYENGDIFNTRNGRTCRYLPIPRKAGTYVRIDGKSKYFRVGELLQKYFPEELEIDLIPERDKRDLGCAYFSDFIVTRDGRVWSRKTRRFLKGNLDHKGYLLFKMCDDYGQIRTCRAHRLVAIGFIPTDDYDLEINHIDGDKLNNNEWNLEWCDTYENHHHARRTGLRHSAMSDADVHWACQQLVEGKSSRSIAKELGISESTVQKLRQGSHRRITSKYGIERLWKWAS